MEECRSSQDAGPSVVMARASKYVLQWERTFEELRSYMENSEGMEPTQATKSLYVFLEINRHAYHLRDR
jgi:hypothetical protein